MVSEEEKVRLLVLANRQIFCKMEDNGSFLYVGTQRLTQSFLTSDIFTIISLLI